MMMTHAPNSPLLYELRTLPVDRQAERLEQTGDTRRALLQAIDEVAALTGVDADDAQRAAQAMTKLADHLDDAEARCRARRAWTRALSYAGRFDEALTVGHESIQIAEANDQRVEAGRARLALMHALCELGRLDEATQIGEEAHRILIDAGKPTIAARADINLGITYNRRDHPKQAVQCFDRARPNLADDPQGLGLLENSRGEALVTLNDFRGAEQAFLAARRAFDEVGQSLNAAIAEGNLADLAYREGRLHMALDYFERARRRFDDESLAVHRARLLAEQADAKSVLGMSAEALHDYTTALNDLQKFGLALEAARARTGIGLIHLRFGRTAEAETALAAAATAFEELGHDTFKAKVDLARAEIALRHNQPRPARELAGRALAVLQDRPADAATARHLLARIALAMNEYHLAEAELQAGIATARQLDLAPLLADLLHLRGQMHQRLGRHRDAVLDLEYAVKQIERLRGMLQADRFRAAYLGERAGVYEDLTAALLADDNDNGRIGEAFKTAERAKSRSLLEQASQVVDLEVSEPRETADSDEIELQQQLQRAQSELSALYSRLDELHTGQTHGFSMNEWRRAVQQREHALQSLETRLSATRGASNLYAQPVALNEVQRHLTAGQIVLEYFACGDELILFALTSETARVVRGLVSLSHLREAVRRVQFQIDRAHRLHDQAGARSERLLQAAQRELRELYDVLIAPIGTLINHADRVTIVPHDALHLVPFHALFDGCAYLIERCEINYAPSSSLLCQLLERSDSTLQERLVVSVADERAPLIENEAHQVAGVLGSGDASTLIGPSATTQRVSLQARNASIIHLACHGRFASENPMYSGLRLADGWLTVRDMYKLRLDADLVTLSACETALSEVSRGDELIGPVRALLASGAKALLVSLWRVNDETTSKIMCDFYRLWHTESEGSISRAAALRQAQIELLRDKPHPMYWAPFVLIGQP